MVLDDLVEIVRDLARVSDVPQKAVPPMLARLAAVQAALAAHLLVAPPTATDTPDEDTLLTAKQAAKRLGTSTDYLYRHSKSFPFAVRLGPRRLRFSSRGIDRYIRQRQGR